MEEKCTGACSEMKYTQRDITPKICFTKLNDMDKQNYHKLSVQEQQT